jgi:hypothetical protein
MSGKGVVVPQTLLRVFSRRLEQGAHSRRFSVDMDPAAGWQVQDERDAEPVRRRTYDDWHRVELAISRFALEAAQLAREGWQEA